MVEKREERKIIPSRCVFAHKRDSKGRVIRHKSRLVAKVFSQVREIDYNEAISPVARFETLRFLLGYVAIHNFELQQVDVKTAFLHVDYDEKIFMDLLKIPSKF